MKIAYFTQVNLLKESGIRTKHLMQAEAWRKLGHIVHFFSIPNTLDNENPKEFPFPHSRYGKRIGILARSPKIETLFRKMGIVKRVVRDLNQYDPDLVYMRSLVWYPGLTNILKNRRVIIEGNTLYRNELEVLGSFYSRLFNKIGERRIPPLLTGVIGVTNEITEYYKKLNNNLLGATIGNGYLVDKLPAELRRPPQNQRAQIVFVGSPGMPWHGVEHFLKMAELLPEYDFHLVGPDLDYSFNLVNLSCLGFMNKDKLFELYSKMDIAVGSLGLYINKMNEGSTLKLKEYAAFGIPIIVNHKDIDLSGQSFVLEVSTEPNFVENNLIKIKKFINAWKGKRVSIEKIRPLIDYTIKEEKRIEFFEKVIRYKRKVKC